jgi:hypothetical protein
MQCFICIWFAIIPRGDTRAPQTLNSPPFVALLTYRAYGYPFLFPLRHNGASAMDNIRQDQMVALKDVEQQLVVF